MVVVDGGWGWWLLMLVVGGCFKVVFVGGIL